MQHCTAAGGSWVNAFLGSPKNCPPKFRTTGPTPPPAFQTPQLGGAAVSIGHIASAFQDTAPRRQVHNSAANLLSVSECPAVALNKQCQAVPQLKRWGGGVGGLGPPPMVLGLLSGTWGGGEGGGGFSPTHNPSSCPRQFRNLVHRDFHNLLCMLNASSSLKNLPPRARIHKRLVRHFPRGSSHSHSPDALRHPDRGPQRVSVIDVVRGSSLDDPARRRSADDGCRGSGTDDLMRGSPPPQRVGPSNSSRRNRDGGLSDASARVCSSDGHCNWQKSAPAGKAAKKNCATEQSSCWYHDFMHMDCTTE